MFRPIILRGLKPLHGGLSIPKEITRRQERKAGLQNAEAGIEARAQARYALELAGQENNVQFRQLRGTGADSRLACGG
jgi:hypothetical protein